MRSGGWFLRVWQTPWGNSVVEAIAADLSSDTATAVIHAAGKRCGPPSGLNE
ncbi:MAG: hypothetical protein IIA44_12355 [Acidobacteria bacterium]|nr:hypothetical protein [Acidobacteriota bacterium]